MRKSDKSDLRDKPGHDGILIQSDRNMLQPALRAGDPAYKKAVAQEIGEHLPNLSGWRMIRSSWI